MIMLMEVSRVVPSDRKLGVKLSKGRSVIVIRVVGFGGEDAEEFMHTVGPVPNSVEVKDVPVGVCCFEWTRYYVCVCMCCA